MRMTNKNIRALNIFLSIELYKFVIYLSNEKQELCLIAEFPLHCEKFIFDKASLNILSLN